jgi:flagellar P-ring protein precursor FlgI
LHGKLSIEVTTTFTPSQPLPYSQGTTQIIAQPRVRAEEAAVKTVHLAEGASVEELIGGLHAVGATARDIVAILQAIKAAGGLQAELEVL